MSEIKSQICRPIMETVLESVHQVRNQFDEDLENV
jgi:hypothetical protein